MRIQAVSIGTDPPREVNAIVEVPVGGEPIKYEMDKDAGTLVVDRFLYTCAAAALARGPWTTTREARRTGRASLSCHNV